MKKGFTVVELIVSFSLTMVIVVFLFQIVISLKNMYTANSLKTELLNKQAIISDNINSSFNKKTITNVTKCGSYCLNFVYSDNTSEILKIDYNENSFQFGSYKTILPDNSYISNPSIDIVYSGTFLENSNNSILVINIPIYNEFLKNQNYGINVLYQYNSNECDLHLPGFNDYDGQYGYLLLNGASTLVINNLEKYEELGYKVFDIYGEEISNANVKVTNPFDNMEFPYSTGEYKIEYELIHEDVVVETLYRYVTVTDAIENFDYTGSEQVFTAEYSGYYKLEVWGAQGGSVDDGIGGYGGYSKGVTYLNKGDKIYINVGGQGQKCSLDSGACISSGGYNGGGYAFSLDQTTSGGGGATHIAKTSGLLATLSTKQDQILIVAGGGGGSGHNVESERYDYGLGGSGNGYIAQNGIDIYFDINEYLGYNGYFGSGATQTSGGKPYAKGIVYSNTNGIGVFGQGGQYSSAIDCCGNSGGGGGYYGGGASTRGHGGAGGGSGYIGNSDLINKEMYCYNCQVSIDSNTLTYSTTNVSEQAISEYAKKGNGYARISYVTDTSFEYPTVMEYSFVSTEQKFIARYSGYYKLEAWGAQGGSADDGIGGYGGYSVGTIYLEEGEILYINVGGQGRKCSLEFGACTLSGGYNGGGYAFSLDQTTSGGGGATHIAKTSGLLATLSTKQDQILIVAGGGGGGGHYSIVGLGGSGNGYIASNGIDVNFGTSGYFGSGATQTSGGKPYADGSVYSNTNGIGVFGQGGQYSSAIACCGNNGGGGGYYGGGASTRGHGGAGGGSGYIGNSDLINKSMYCYKCQTSSEKDKVTYSTENVSEQAISEYAKKGNGYARISYVGKEI